MTGISSRREDGVVYMGIPSGSLQDKTLLYLLKAGIITQEDITSVKVEKNYEIQTKISDLILRILDRRDMPAEIHDGVVDF